MTVESSTHPIGPRAVPDAQRGARFIRPRRQRFRRAVFLSGPFALFALLLLGIEGGVRWRRPRVTTLEALLRPTFPGLIDEKEGEIVFEGDPALGWQLKPNLRDQYWDFTVFSTNELGLRHPRPIDPKGSTFRIVCLGDSVTFGYRVPVAFPQVPALFDRNALPYPRLLERLLREVRPDHPIEVIALAVPGYTSHQGRVWLNRTIDHLQPDLVTTCFGWNDTDPAVRPDRETLPRGGPGLWRRQLMARSQAAVYLVRWLEERRSRDAGNPATLPRLPRVSIEDYVENHLAIARLSRRHGAGVLIIGPVYRDSQSYPDQARRIGAYRAALAQAAAREGIPYLEITRLTEKGHPDNASLFGELIHPNELGHRMMAAAVARALENQGLLASAGPRRGALPAEAGP